jgi:AcrR family transcriptional regulator
MTDRATTLIVRPFVPPADPRTPKSQRTRQRLLDLAGDLFIERGYGAVSMRDVAAAAGLTKGAVYGHFRSKGQLLIEVIRTKLAARDAETDYVAAAADPERGVELMFDERSRDIRLLEVDAAAAARHDPDVAAGLAAHHAAREERIRDAAANLSDPDAAVWVITALSLGIGMKDAVGLARPGDERLRAALHSAVTGFD